MTFSTADLRAIATYLRDEDIARDDYNFAPVLAYAERNGSANLGDFQEAYQGYWKDATDFAMNLADDLGMIDRNLSWPHTHIDWEAAADELRYDYDIVDAPGGGVFAFRNI